MRKEYYIANLVQYAFKQRFRLYFIASRTQYMCVGIFEILVLSCGALLKSVVDCLDVDRITLLP